MEVDESLGERGAALVADFDDVAFLELTLDLRDPDGKQALLAIEEGFPGPVVHDNAASSRRLAQDPAVAGINSEDSFRSWLLQDETTENRFRDLARIELLVKKTFAKEAEVKESEVEKYFNENKATFKIPATAKVISLTARTEEVTKKALELLKDEVVKATMPFDWKPGVWTEFRLQVRKVKDGEWKVEGKLWPQGAAEPNEWMVTFDEKEEPVSGRPSVLGSPFSGTPIWFDDLVVERLGRK